MNTQSIFAQRLESGLPVTLSVFGTSLSYHVAPLLRSAFQSYFGEQVTIVNAGMAGRASRSGLAYVEEKVISRRPDVVLMEFAINDAHDYHHEPGAHDQGISLEESRENLELLVSRIEDALLQSEVILWTTNATFDVEGSVMRGLSARPDLEDYYQGVREVASARGLRVIDGEKFWKTLHKQMGEDFSALIPDGVHPTPKALREYLIPFLLRELGVPAQTS